MGVMVRSFEATVQALDRRQPEGHVRHPAGFGRRRLPARLAAGPADDLAADRRWRRRTATSRCRSVPRPGRDPGHRGFRRERRARGHLAMIEGGPAPRCWAGSTRTAWRVRRRWPAKPSPAASAAPGRPAGAAPGARTAPPCGDPAGRLCRLRQRAGQPDPGPAGVPGLVQDPRAASLRRFVPEAGRRPRGGGPAPAARDRPGLLVRSNGALRAQVVRIFRQTFAITYALEVIGLAVALAGLAQSLAGLALARRGEVWTLRALGASEGRPGRGAAGGRAAGWRWPGAWAGWGWACCCPGSWCRCSIPRPSAGP